MTKSEHTAALERCESEELRTDLPAALDMLGRAMAALRVIDDCNDSAICGRKEALALLREWNGE